MGVLLRQPISKYLLLLLVLVLVAFLAFEPSPTRTRQLQIDAALEHGTIGGLSGSKNALLYETLQILGEAAGIEKKIALNSPYREGHLNIYTTTPAAQDITNCGSGNAVYDPTLDAMFIDTSIVQPFSNKTLSSLLGKGRVVTDQLVSTYLHFVILHELGHRQLHRKLGITLFDTTSEGLRNIEDEADDFALRKLFDIYQKYHLTSRVAASGAYGSSSGMMWVNSEEMEQSEPNWLQTRASLDLVVTLQIMTKGMLLADYAFSPFYGDAAHRTFIARALRIINALDKVPSLDAAIVNRKEYMRRYLNRFLSASDAKVIEVAVPEWIQHAAFDKGDLLILSDTDRGYRVTQSQMQMNDANSGPLSLVATLAPEAEGLFPWLHLESSERSSTLGPGRVMAEDISETVGVLLHDDYLFEAYEQAYPQRQALVTVHHSRNDLPVMTGEDTTFFVSIGEGYVPIRKSYRAIQQKYASLSGEKNGDLEPLQWLDGAFYFWLRGSQGTSPTKSFVVLHCNGATLACDNIKRFQSGALSLKTRRLALALDNGQLSAYVLAAVQTPQSHNWQLWRLSENAPPVLVATHPFLPDEPPALRTDPASKGLKDDFFEADTQGDIHRLVSVPPNHLLLNLANDSCYLFDPARNSLEIVFHPCGGNVQVTVDHAGTIALFAGDSRKLFALKPRAER